MLSKLAAWFPVSRDVPGSLTWMSLGPDNNTKNPLMIQFFTWDSARPDMSWWKHFENEVPRLAELGVTQVWLPPPNKGTNDKSQGYDAYDLVILIRRHLSWLFLAEYSITVGLG